MRRGKKTYSNGLDTVHQTRSCSIPEWVLFDTGRQCYIHRDPVLFTRPELWMNSYM
jgi:hypothetical protein